MGKPIYFSKVLFTEGFHYSLPKCAILLNLPSRELSYQVFSWKRNTPIIQKMKEEQIIPGDESTRQIFGYSVPAKLISTSETGFKKILLEDDQYEQIVEFNYAIKLSDWQYNDLLPYCNALDFEPYRDKRMSMNDEGYVGYRDESKVCFAAITDSYIPYIELPMDLYYDESHIWPNEKLYRYIYQAFLSKNKKLERWTFGYGACSLFGV